MTRAPIATLVFSLVALSLASPSGAQPVTYSKDIAPIIYKRCTPCHRPGEIGPFPLQDYRDVRQRLTLISDALQKRLMPPWKPEEPADTFLEERALSDDERRRLQAWISAGGPEGDPKDLPERPTFTDGWQFGTPDVVVSMPEAYTLRPDGPDLFRSFVLPIPTNEAKYVSAIEFRPGKGRGVHHANIGVDRTRSSRRLDASDAELGYVGGMVQDAAYPVGYLLGWTPGQLPRPSPADMPWRLEANSDLVVQLHLQPTGRPEPIQISVGFFFTDKKPTRSPFGLRLGSETIDIAPGDAHYEIRDRFVLPVDVELYALQPHAHNLGREMYADATLPDGTVRQLITIRDWDFRWQDVYRYSTPVPLPKGSTIAMRFVYDNSAGNPRNSFTPPQRVVWGQNTTDEMGDLWMQLVPLREEDAPALSADIARKTRLEDIAAYTRVEQADPSNPLRHDALGMLYLQDGRPQEAVKHFLDSLRLNKDSASTHYNLGLAYSMLREFADATREYESAVRLEPDHAEAHNNLGAMLHVAGRLDQAATHYRRALELRPENAEAHANLGRLLTLQGKTAEAAEQFEAGLAAQPASVASLTGLAWIRATAATPSLRRPGQAVALAERARQLTRGQDPQAFDALAAGYAALNDFANALVAIKAGVRTAEAAGQAGFAAEMLERQRLYEQNKPFIR